MEFEIPVAMKSNNQILGRHWSVKNKDKHLYLDEIWVALREYGYESETHDERFATVKVTRLFTSPKREMDVDNLHIKGCIDSLTELEILKDDCPKWADITKAQEKSDRNAVLIEIEYS